MPDVHTSARMRDELSPTERARLRWILLLLLEGGTGRTYNEPIAGRTRLVKLLFLMKEAFKLRSVPYEFTPYYFGPFSPEIYRDLMLLRSAGLVQWQETLGGDEFSLTPKGVRVANELRQGEDSSALEKLRTCKERYNRMSLEELLRVIYDRFPRFAERSVVSKKNLLDVLRREFEAAGIDEEAIEEAIREFRALREG